MADRTAIGVIDGDQAWTFLVSDQMRHTGCLMLDAQMLEMHSLDLQRWMVYLRRPSTIFVTAHSQQDTRTRTLDQGAVAFLYKAFRWGSVFSLDVMCCGVANCKLRPLSN